MKVENRTYFLYKYTWEIDGHTYYYYGKTYIGSDRYGNASRYKDQYVYRFFLKNKPCECIIKYDENPLKIGYLESVFVARSSHDIYNLNVKQENWISEIQQNLKDYYKTEERFYKDLVEMEEWRKTNEKEIQDIINVN